MTGVEEEKEEDYGDDDVNGETGTTEAPSLELRKEAAATSLGAAISKSKSELERDTGEKCVPIAHPHVAHCMPGVRSFFGTVAASAAERFSLRDIAKGFQFVDEVFSWLYEDIEDLALRKHCSEAATRMACSSVLTACSEECHPQKACGDDKSWFLNGEQNVCSPNAGPVRRQIWNRINTGLLLGKVEREGEELPRGGNGTGAARSEHLCCNGIEETDTKTRAFLTYMLQEISTPANAMTVTPQSHGCAKVNNRRENMVKSCSKREVPEDI
jgi:hypothetical protein